MRTCLFTALVSAFVASAHATVVISTFDADADGWSAVDLFGGSYANAGTPFAVTYQGAGGNGGGYIEATDPSVGSFFFEAPAKFLGNQSAFYGESLRFDLKVDLGAATVWEEGVEVILAGAGLVLLRDIGIVPPTSWQTFSFNLDETGWTKEGGGAPTPAEFQSVLGNLQQLRILGEYGNGVYETTGLDNICLVPELDGTGVLAALGLVGLALARARRPASRPGTAS
jgi:hypothetical protein